MRSANTGRADDARERTRAAEPSGASSLLPPCALSGRSRDVPDTPPVRSRSATLSPLSILHREAAWLVTRVSAGLAPTNGGLSHSETLSWHSAHNPLGSIFLHLSVTYASSVRASRIFFPRARSTVRTITSGSLFAFSLIFRYGVQVTTEESEAHLRSHQ